MGHDSPDPTLTRNRDPATGGRAVDGHRGLGHGHGGAQRDRGLLARVLLAVIIEGYRRAD